MVISIWTVKVEALTLETNSPFSKRLKKIPTLFLLLFLCIIFQDAFAQGRPLSPSGDSSCNSYRNSRQ